MARTLLTCTILVVAHCRDQRQPGSKIAGDTKGYLSRYAAAYGNNAVHVDASTAHSAVAPEAPTLSPATTEAVGAENKAVAALLPEFGQSAEKCSTVEELRRWHHHHIEHINKFVPPGVQKFATQAIEKDYQKRLGELEPGSTPSKERVKGSEAVAPSKVKSFPAMLDDAQACQSREELEAWRDAVNAHIQRFMRPEYHDLALGDVQRRFEQRLVQLQKANAADSVNIAPAPATAPVGDEVFPKFLRAVDKCNSEQELQAWRSAITDFVEERVPPQLRPLALADVQKHYELRLAKLHTAATQTAGSSIAGNMGIAVARPPLQPPAQVLASMFQEADHCENETELRAWRQRVASHIRANIPLRFQIPALGEMQMRFERRLDVLRKAASNAKAVAEGKDVVDIATTEVNNGGGASTGASWMLVLAGLSLPALIAFVSAVMRARGKVVAPRNEHSTDMYLLER